MTRRHARRRSGYTLIELLVASAIATLLMLALYSALDLTVTQTEIGRERVAHTDLTRALVNRMSADFSCTLGVLPPQSGQSSGSGSSGSTGMADTGTGATDGTTTQTLVPFQAGVIGDEQHVTLFVSRTPQALLGQASASAAAADPNTVLPPGVKRVTYYMATDGSGLCRQERNWVTAPGTGDDTTLDTSNQAAELYAPEVKEVAFAYWDPVNSADWTSVTTWDGSTAGSDGSAVVGPPRAIRVKFTFSLLDDRGQTVTKDVYHVFPIRASVGYAVPSSGTGGKP